MKHKEEIKDLTTPIQPHNSEFYSHGYLLKPFQINEQIENESINASWSADAKEAMDLYAAEKAKGFAEWIRLNCRMYDNEFHLYNAKEDVLELKTEAELYQIFLNQNQEG